MRFALTYGQLHVVIVVALAADVFFGIVVVPPDGRLSSSHVPFGAARLHVLYFFPRAAFRTLQFSDMYSLLVTSSVSRFVPRYLGES